MVLSFVSIVSTGGDVQLKREKLCDAKTFLKCCIVGNWMCFNFLNDIRPLIQEAPSVVTNWRGVSGF